MRILVLNSGSSSIKFSVFDAAATGASLPPACSGEITGIGTPKTKFETHGFPAGTSLPGGEGFTADTPVAGTRVILDAVSGPGMPPIDAVGYRVVHPGPKLDNHTGITPEVLHDLEEATAFAPLHDPTVVDVIREAQLHLPKARHFACFDTVFHRTMPEEAAIYPIPRTFRDQGVRRYGFHGLSCESIVQQFAGIDRPIPKRMVICHLGSGCSVTALRDGRSIDTSMGLTPTGGVVMGTRPGDLDPGLMLYLLRQQKDPSPGAARALEHMLNHDAGIAALSGMPNDVKALRKAAAQGNANAILALKVFTRSVTKAIGGYAWLLGGLDAIVFAGGIGEHDPLTRTEVLGGLESFGIAINSELNQQKTSGPRVISTSESVLSIFVIPAKEDLAIARHVSRMARSA